MLQTLQHKIVPLIFEEVKYFVLKIVARLSKTFLFVWKVTWRIQEIPNVQVHTFIFKSLKKSAKLLKPATTLEAQTWITLQKMSLWAKTLL